MKDGRRQASTTSLTSPPHEMAPNNTTPRPVDHTGPQSQMTLPLAPQSQVPQNPAPQNPAPQNQEPQASTAADASQPSQPAQTQPEPIVMQCCQKTAALRRDCECTVPQGPCEAPGLLFTHYSPQCNCYSCEWLRETKMEFPDGDPGNPVGSKRSPTFGANSADDVLKTDTSSPCTNLELVHPIQLREKPRPRWEWVFHPVDQNQLPFLVEPKNCSGVLGATLDSRGHWKALCVNGTSFPLSYDTRPVLNELYRDYGYDPDCSPVSIFYPDLV